MLTKNNFRKIETNKTLCALILFSTLLGCAPSIEGEKKTGDDPAPTPAATPGPAVALSISGPASTYTGNCSTAFTLLSIDSRGITTAVATNTTINLSGEGNGAFYGTAGCGGGTINSVSIASGSNSASFYFMDDTAESLTLSASDAAASLTAATQSFTIVSLRPLTSVISTSVPLVDSSLSTIAPPTVALGGLVPTGAPGIPAAAAAPIGAGVADVGNGDTATETPIATTGTAPTRYDATTGSSITVNVSATFPAGATPACATLAPFGAVTCATTGFSVTSAQMTSGNFQIRASASNGGANDYLDSNTLTARKFFVQQVVDTKNDIAATDYTTSPVVYNSKLYFYSYNRNGYGKLFSYDPAFGTLTQISNTRNSHTADDLMSFLNFNLTVFNGKLYFQSTSSAGLNKLFAYDSVANAIVQVSSTNAASDNISTGWVGSSFLINPTRTEMYFVASLANFSKIFKMDSLGAVTAISNTRGSGASDSPSGLTIYNNNLYFIANNSSNYSKIFKYDGTNVTQISNIRGGTTSDTFTYPTVYNGDLYFTSTIATSVTKLFKFNDVSGIITQVTNLRNDNALDDAPAYMTVHNSKLYFSAKNSLGATKLFKHDGTTTTQVSNTRNSNNANDSPTSLLFNHQLGTNANFYSASGKLFFSSRNTNNVTKLFMYDDTAGTITQISNTRGDQGLDDSPSWAIVYNGRLYFQAIRESIVPNIAIKLFTYDLTTGDFSQVSNITGSNYVSDLGSAYFMPTSGNLYFVAYNPNVVFKLFRLCDLAAGCTEIVGPLP